MDPLARRAAESREAPEMYEEIVLAWVCGPLLPAPEPGPRQNIAPLILFNVFENPLITLDNCIIPSTESEQF